MTHSRKHLYWIWSFISYRAGWLNRWSNRLDEDELKILEEIDEEASLVIKEAKEDYTKRILPEVKEQDAEFVKEIQAEYGKELEQQKAEWIKNEIKRVYLIWKNMWIDYQSSIDKGRPWFLRKAVSEINNISSLEKKIKFLLWQKHIMENADISKFKRFSPIEIAKAKEVDWNNFLEFDKRGFAFCPFHSESKASFHIMKKSNTGHCFGCDWTGTIINFLMEKDSIGFRKAMQILLKT